MTAPTIAGDVSSADLGSVTVSANSSTVVTVQCPEDGDYTLTPTVTGSGFSISPSGAQSVSAGTVLVITVTFTPTAVQSYSESLDIERSLPKQIVNGLSTTLMGSVSVTLTGEGIEDPANTNADADDDSAAGGVGETKQRATLYVPSFASVVNLGAAWNVEDTTLTQNGFSAMTSGHVFMKAEGSVTMQATGQVWFQSGKSHVHTVAGKNAYLIAAQDMYLGAADYMGIMAGYAPDPMNGNSTYSDADPGTAAPVDGVDAAFLANNISWEAFGLVCNGVTLANAAVSKTFLKKLKNWKTWFTLYIPALLAVTGTISTITAWATGASYKATFVFGEAGIMAATPDYMYLMSGLRVSYRSINSTVLATMSASVTALMSARLVTVFGEVSARSATKVVARSGKKVNVYCTLKDLEMYGATMQIGGKSADTFHVPTLSNNLTGVAAVSMENSVPFVGKVENLSDVKVAVSAEVKAELDCLESATISCGAFEVRCTLQGVSFTKGGEEVLKLAPGLITLGPAAGQIKMVPAAADLGGGAMKVTPAGLITMVTSADLL